MTDLTDPAGPTGASDPTGTTDTGAPARILGRGTGRWDRKR
ncbi:hypothetical protein [Streptomyces albidochromogenes]|nr:hypothetical protein [Streptomyces albidochromogenes]